MTDPSSAPTPPRTVSVHSSTILAACVVLIALVGAAVALALARWEVGAIVGLLTAVVGIAAVALGQLDQMSKSRVEQAAQGVTLATIDRRTNGELDARIASAVHAALDQRTASGSLVALPTGGAPTVPSGQSTVDTPPTTLAA